MKALLGDLRSGQVNVVDLPEPELRDGGVLVHTAFSTISAGTEHALLNTARKSLVGKALARPDLVKQVLRFARSDGIQSAYRSVRSRLESGSALGYSCSGVVVATGTGVQEFQLGDRVACAGVGYANHSSVNFVPKNLLAKIPESVPLDAASLTAIGAIALQGLRQSDVRFGETVAVIGAGLIGVLTIQLAKAAGCRVIGIDVQPARVENAVRLGADLGLLSHDTQTPVAVRNFSRYGADVVIITAATPSTEAIELAAEISRDRGRIVVVGTVGLGVSRRNVYGKELSIVMSRSYGPGRYDAKYEEEGLDYPIGYVRWTEQRNMEAFLQCLSSGRIDVASLIENRIPIEEGERAYSDLRASGAYTALLEYSHVVAEYQPKVNSQDDTGSEPKSRSLRVGCIGAGVFARAVVYPALRKFKGVTLSSIATASGVTALSACKSFGFAQADTSDHVLRSSETDVVFVLSRPATHAQYVVAALMNRKPVFVEKPLAVGENQLDELCCVYQAAREAGHSPFVMVGFNRRFAPMTGQINRFFAHRQEPMAINVRVNAGYIPLDHWTQQKSEGGRIVGEFCHFVDWVRAVVGRPIQSVSARALPDHSRYNRDNVAVTLSFSDGSIANLLYLANGDKAVAKEYFEVFCEGGVAILDDFRTLELTRDGKTTKTKSRRDKGHARELHLTIEAVCTGAASPIPFEELLEVSRACFAVERAIGIGEPVSIAIEAAAGS
jgi:predicted dehydrogenase/threonine dehydrogenase-like Zn-dependent dehydrogenase